MIGHDNISGLQTPSGAPIETILKMRALSAAAVTVLAADLVPKTMMRQKRQITQRTVLGFIRPLADPLDIGSELLEKRPLPLNGKFQPALA